MIKTPGLSNVLLQGILERTADSKDIAEFQEYLNLSCRSKSAEG